MNTVYYIYFTLLFALIRSFKQEVVSVVENTMIFLIVMTLITMSHKETDIVISLR
jgi:hypothetical protein